MGYIYEDIKKLGFGLMRLPMTGEKVDMEQFKAMVDEYIAQGFTYFDTAHGYLKGESEKSVKEGLTQRYERSTYQLVSKMPIWECENEEDPQRIFDEQLERTGAGYFDIYLVHAVSGDNYEKLNQLKVWDFMKSLKDRGLAKHIGFSFHDDADTLDRILNEHPEAEVVQLQINYKDWDDKDVQSAKCYNVCRKHSKPVIIMEPVKGGSLANVHPDAAAFMTQHEPNASQASWAIRYCASLEGVVTVLSGMSTLEQMRDNLGYMKEFKPLDSEEREVIKKVVEKLDSLPTIPCTACSYCTEKCPQNINIPKIMSLLNHDILYNSAVKDHFGYTQACKDHGKASDCLKCGICEGRCPQHIGIIAELEKAVSKFE